MKQPLKGTAVRIHTVIADIFGNLFNCRGSVRQQNTAFFNTAFFKVFREALEHYNIAIPVVYND